MDEAARIKRNDDRLTECFPEFAPRIKTVLTALEAQWLAVAEQTEASPG